MSEKHKNLDLPNIPVDEKRYEGILHEIVDLPSKGLMYNPKSELSQGTIRMKYMTAKEEDILTNESFINTGRVFDELFKSLILSPINYDDLLIADRNAIMVAARILSYGEHYEMEVDTPSGNKQGVVVNLKELQHKEFDASNVTPGTNKFKWTTSTGHEIEFKLLTVQDEKKIQQTVSRMKKTGRVTNFTSRLRQMIISVNGDSSPGTIASFVNNHFLAKDTREFRKHIREIQPNLDFNIEVVDEVTGETFQSDVTFGPNLFWPDVEL